MASLAAAGSVLGARPGAAAEAATPGARGLERPDDCLRVGHAWQYKRWGNHQMARIVDGELDRAVECLHAALERFPGDPEYYYLLAAVHTRRDELDEALDYTRRALDAGLPLQRFLAGPREIFAPLIETDTFGRWNAHAGTDLIHGPMLGTVTDRSARFWVRTFHPITVSVVARQADGRGPRIESSFAVSAPERDYTAVVSVDGLSPDTEYTYRLKLDGADEGRTWSFTTFPAATEPGRFELGFGGCAGYTPWHERIWRRIAAHRFPVFLLTGDNVYIDDPIRQEVQQYCYYRRQSRPEFRAFVSGTSVAAIWDDHDFADNDSIGGPDIDRPAWKVPVWNTFRNNWNNPAYGFGEEQPGCWFDFSMGDVDVFMLDDRYYRTRADAGSPTMLGSVQKQWLCERLSASAATFKLIVTSVPWAYGVKPGSSDPWQGYLEERDEIFAFLRDNRIDGVILLSGDRHRADIWKIERPGAYPLYDFENGRLTNLHTHDVLPGALFGYNAKCTYGRLRFDTTRRDPVVTYDIINIDGDLVHSFSLNLSEISHAS